MFIINIDKTMNEELAAQIEQNIYEFINNASIQQLVEIITFAKDKYFNGESVISDETYDILIEQLTLLDKDNPVLQEVAHDITSVNSVRVKLPYHMGSMSKIKPSDEKVFEKWKSKYTGPYIVSNKLDGVSAMLIINKNNTYAMYTKGKDGIGADISHLIQYINIVNFDRLHQYVLTSKIDKLVLRGELIMKKKIFFEKYSNFSNPRNFVSGQINSKTVNINYLKDVDLVFYEVIYPWQTIDRQYNILTSLELGITNFELITNNTLILNQLSHMLKNRLAGSIYEMDGLIISDINEHFRNSSGNPDYSFAFKETLIVLTAEVEQVEWNESKHGYLKPTILIKPINIGGVEIKRATGFNAKYIMEHNIGPGTILKIMRSGDVIPHIVKIDVPTYAHMPDPDEYGNWKFNKSGVDIIVVGMSKGRLIKTLANFTKQLEIKGIDEATFGSLVNVNIILNITDLFELTIEKLMDLNLPGFGIKKITNIVTSLQKGFDKMTLLDFMVGSNIFGIGFGEKKIKKILSVYPDIILKSYLPISKLIQMIDDIDGFDEITAEQFAVKLSHFNELLEKVPSKYKNKMLAETMHIVKKTVSGHLSGQKIVITGFRDKIIEKYIIDNGGVLNDNVSKNTTLVIYADNMDENTNKLIKAKELGIKLIKKSVFINH